MESGDNATKKIHMTAENENCIISIIIPGRDQNTSRARHLETNFITHERTEIRCEVHLEHKMLQKFQHITGQTSDIGMGDLQAAQAQTITVVPGKTVNDNVSVEFDRGTKDLSVHREGGANIQRTGFPALGQQVKVEAHRLVVIITIERLVVILATTPASTSAAAALTLTTAATLALGSAISGLSLIHI